MLYQMAGILICKQVFAILCIFLKNRPPTKEEGGGLLFLLNIFI